MKIKNFALLKGENVLIANGMITVMPKNNSSKSEKDLQLESANEIRSDILFSQGILSFKLKAESDNSLIMLLWEENSRVATAIGHSMRSKTFAIQSDFGDVESGGLKNYKSSEELNIKIEILGSTARIIVNNIRICEQTLNVKSTPIHLRLLSDGKLELFDFEVEPIKPKLFIVMQFTDDYNKLYEEVIRPVSEKEGFECIRADEYYSSTPILTDIIRSIEESHAIIAEITPDNPNVFYEIGYSHAIKKPTILLCDKKRDKLPFDISSFRTLFYENTIAGKSSIEKSLQKYLNNIK